MSADFLSSDIIFQADSPSSKISEKAMEKLPESVNWALHDYYSTACEKAFVPIQSLADLKQLDPVGDDLYLPEEKPVFTSSDVKQLMLLQDKMKVDDCQSLLLLLSNMTRKTTPTPPPKTAITAPVDSRADVRASLCGALMTVDNHIQDNHPFRVKQQPAYHGDKDNDACYWREALFQETFFCPNSSADSIDAPTVNSPTYKSDEDCLQGQYLFHGAVPPTEYTIDDSPVNLTSSLNNPHFSSSMAMHGDHRTPSPAEPIVYPREQHVFQHRESSGDVSSQKPSEKKRSVTIAYLPVMPTVLKGALNKFYKNISKPFVKHPSPATQEPKTAWKEKTSSPSPPQHRQFQKLFGKRR